MNISKLSLKNRIALSYLGLTAGLILIIFIVLYLVVYNTVYTHLDEDLDSEASELSHSILALGDSLLITNKLEWNEAEHKQIEVNPTFMQIMNNSGNLIRKTPNLLDDFLPFQNGHNEKFYRNMILSNSSVRLLQEPILSSDGIIAGYIIVAIPLEESEMVLTNLLTVLFIAFPFVIVILFFSTRIIASKSISPIANIIKTAETITRENLTERINLPHNKDELYRLVTTINDLLDRLEFALIREQQFTSDASHELRTPLSAIKGTLEVLIRKPREIEQYEEKIRYSIGEVDRMTALVEQLLLLARYDAGKIVPQIEMIDLSKIIDNIIERLSPEIIARDLTIQINLQAGTRVKSDASLLEIIFSNIISNSLKYSGNGSFIEFGIIKEDNKTAIVISDNGFGMDETQLNRIFDRFYRADNSRTKTTHGVGLGLSIVKKLCDLLDLEVIVESAPMRGTKFIITFPSN